MRDWVRLTAQSSRTRLASCRVIGFIAICSTLISTARATSQQATPAASQRSELRIATSAQEKNPSPAPSDAPAAPASNLGTHPDETRADAATTLEKRTKSLRVIEENLKALLRGELHAKVEPATLFSIPLDDEDAVRVERRRLLAIVETTAGASVPGHETDNDTELVRDPAGDARPGAVASAASIPERIAAATGSVVRAIAPPPHGDVRVEPKLWKASLAVDRARLAFLNLDLHKRRQLLMTHEQRRSAAAPDAAERALSKAEKKAEAAEQARSEALVAAKQARTEAARLVVEEKARLLALIKQQAEYETLLLKQQEVLTERQETFLGLQRKVREATRARAIDTPAPEAMNALYDSVRGTLREARDRLAELVPTLVQGAHGVPDAGEDRLVDVPRDVDRQGVDQLRRELSVTGAALRKRKEALLTKVAAELYEQIVGLNASRLALLPYLTNEKRVAITGFNPSGLDQASGEVMQVSLVLRYHLAATLRWLSDLRRPGAARGQSAFAASMQALKWLVPIAVFVWWRRRADRSLLLLSEALKDSKPHTASRPGLAESAVDYLRRVRSPLEWLLFVWVAISLMPPTTAKLLEVQLLRTVFTWTLGGALVVQSIDFIAGYEAAHHARKTQFHTAHLRLRSLRLIGTVVVGFGLILSLSTELVGRGTIYGWVWGFCWFAALPMLLVIVRWWSPIIFERVDQKRKKSPLESWIVRNQRGWQSFAAAFIGGALLLAFGLFRFFRTWVSGFELSRRVLAYLFRKEISKKAGSRHELAFKPISAGVHAKLGPEVTSKSLVPSIADAQVSQVIQRINAPGGGVFAVVGERGAGKTTLLGRIVSEADDVHVVRCPFGGLESFVPVLLKALGAAPNLPIEQAAAAIDIPGREVGLLIDDAHRLITPSMGGLQTFDGMLEIARQNSRHAAWVFAFDEVIWQFFERMRGSRPLFDTVIYLAPWREPAIANLLMERSEAVGIRPSFEHLLSELPADADEIDVAEAVSRTETAYYRLIWDYAGGNPGVALNAWRNVLGVDADGQVSVKVFQAPDAEALEGLPEDAMFVFRAIVQLERATPDQISRATGIALSQVHDAIRFGMVRGYFDRSEAGYAVTWPWFRAITRYLTRRHLLVPRIKQA